MATVPPGDLGAGLGRRQRETFLLVAGLLEVVWAYFMKQSQGFTRPMPTAVTWFWLASSAASATGSGSTKPYFGDPV